ncbi:MAG: FlgO family outer membrane protein [Thiotrichaceae bacterium]
MNCLRSQLNKLLIITLSLLVASCARYFGMEHVAYGNCAYRVQTAECAQSGDINDLIQRNFEAADKLIHEANLSNRLKKRQRFVITTLADVNNFAESTSLGRLISEQITQRFVQQQFDVFDARLHSHLMVSSEGEFVLSRTMRDVGRAQRAHYLIAGTYAVGETQVYVTLKMLNFATGKVMASQAYSLPKDANVRALLQEYLWW